MVTRKIKIRLLCFLMILMLGGLAFGEHMVLIDGTATYFEYRRTITIQSGQVAGGPHSNFPMLFDSTKVDSGLRDDLRTQGNAGKVRNANGDDIVFATGEGVEILKHEIEYYDDGNGDYVAWVRVESINNGTEFYLYYGSDNSISYPANFTTDVWSNGYRAVWHLKDGTPTTVTYYFNGSTPPQWNNYPQFDNGLGTDHAWAGEGVVTHTFNSNSCADDFGTITKVELRVLGGAWSGECNDDITLQPVFSGGDGDDHQLDMYCSSGGGDYGWSIYADITTDANAPSPWTWTDVQNLGCKAKHTVVSSEEYVLGARCEIRVTYLAGGSGAIKDSTLNNMHGTDNNNPILGATGKIDNAIDFDGSQSQYINIPYYNLGNDLAYSFWFKRLGTGDQYIFSFMRTAICLRDDRITWWPNTGVAGENVSWTPDTNWNHLVVNQWGSTNCSIFLNGSSVHNESASAIDTSSMNRDWIGRMPAAYFTGIVDEVRISDGPRSSGWIWTQHNNQDNPAAFYSISGPTLIELSYFRAKALDSAVILEWKTETELDNAGFNLWRSEERDGGYVRNNPYFIPSEGDAGFGAEYNYMDYDVTNGVIYYYKLEDIDINGNSTFHGPVSATPNDIIPIWPDEGKILPSGTLLFSWASSGSFYFKVEISMDPSFPVSEWFAFPGEEWTNGHSLWLTPREWEMVLSKAQQSGGQLFWRVRAKNKDGREIFSDWKRFVIEKPNLLE